MKSKEPVWLDKSHPNYERWKRSRELKYERGRLVKQILESEIELFDRIILDLGSGEGGTSAVLSDENFVLSSDRSLVRLKRQKADEIDTAKIQHDGARIPFKKNSIEIIILQDVIEHVPDLESLVGEVDHCLKSGGSVYLSTPNKYSLLNFISDPHWGLPFISFLSRRNLARYVLRFLRKKDAERDDLAELLPLKHIFSLFGRGYDIKIKTDFVINELFKGHKGILWSNFHIKLLKLVMITNLEKAIRIISNDRPGFVNNFLTPEFYFVLTKKQS